MPSYHVSTFEWFCLEINTIQLHLHRGVLEIKKGSCFLIMC